MWNPNEVRAWAAIEASLQRGETVNRGEAIRSLKAAQEADGRRTRWTLEDRVIECLRSAVESQSFARLVSKEWMDEAHAIIERADRARCPRCGADDRVIHHVEPYKKCDRCGTMFKWSPKGEGPKDQDGTPSLNRFG